MTRDFTALLGASFGLGGPALVLVCRVWPWSRTGPAAPAAGPVPTAFRYCPAELRTRAVVPHADGTATCSCGTNIPRPDQDGAL
jgi:hypothetical protein